MVANCPSSFHPTQIRTAIFTAPSLSLRGQATDPARQLLGAFSPVFPSPMATPSSNDPGPTGTDTAVVTMSAPAKRSFYDLPIEVRLEIYELLYCYSKPIHLTLDHDGKIKHQRAESATSCCAPDLVIPVHAFTVAKTLCHEASPVLYQRNNFSMDWKNLKMFSQKWDQELSSYLGAVEIICDDGPAWGFVPVTRLLVDKMPGLQEINFKISGSLRLAAAALETSSAITPCASMFGGPELDLVLQPLKSEDCNGGKGGSDLVAIRNGIQQDNAKLAEIWPEGLAPNNITRSCAPILSHIRLSGRISRTTLDKILGHRCLPGDCFWEEVAQEVKEGDAAKVIGENKDATKMAEKNGSSDKLTEDMVHYKWKAMVPGERTDVPKIDMRQWYPPLTEKEQQKVRDFFKVFEQRDSCCKSDSASEIESLPKDATASAEPGSTDHGGTSQDAFSRDAENQEVVYAEGAESAASTASANPDDLLGSLQQLAFADCFENLNSEFLHQDLAEVRAALLEYFGDFAFELFPDEFADEN
ncbi:hypothetical protein FOPE_03366 [Fonsecaea pedrosoi]|nr:hypothetical protein FOPE_03366 [Fonsecaea pedrosoi]